MTDLREEERKALEAVDHIGYLIRRFATIKDREAGEHLVRDLATIRSALAALAAREYSKQREEKLRERARELIDAHDDWSVNGYPSDGGTAIAARAWFDEAERVEGAVENLRAALAENGDGHSDAVRNRLVEVVIGPCSRTYADGLAIELQALLDERWPRLGAAVAVKYEVEQ